MCQRFEDNPGDEVGLEDLYPKETEESYQGSLRRNSEPYQGPWRIPAALEVRWAQDCPKRGGQIIMINRSQIRAS